MKQAKPYYPKVRIGPNGGVRLLDVDAYLSQPKILEQVARVRALDLTGKKLGARTTDSPETPAPVPGA